MNEQVDPVKELMVDLHEPTPQFTREQAIDSVGAAQQRIAELEAERDAAQDLVIHAWVHSGYPDCGYRQMTTEQKAIYDGLVGRDRDARELDDDDRMDICSQPGTKVVFDEGGGLEGERVEARKAGLVKGNTYTVRYVSVSSWSSLVVLEEVAGGFNTCLFTAKIGGAK